MARSSMEIPDPISPFPFLELPLELREQVYANYFNPFDRIRPAQPYTDDYKGGQYGFDLRLLRVNKAIHNEATEVWRRSNHFIRIMTPWPQTAHYVTQEATLPIVCANENAAKFKHYHATVAVSAPLHDISAAFSLIILADDLPQFSEVWYYSVLNNHAQMNQHLKLEITLQDPYYPADPKPIPYALQKKILLPFGCIRQLYQVETHGFHTSLKQELARQMAIPYPTLAQSLESCRANMAAGDELLQHTPTSTSSSRPSRPTKDAASGALQKYTAAFHSIHILISGRKRRIQADEFFDELVPSGPYKDQVGTTIRIFLRIALVSRLVATYLHLGQPLEAAFWGWRSIRIVQGAMGLEFEQFVQGRAERLDMGLLYLRTGVAVRELEGGGEKGWEEEVAGEEQGWGVDWRPGFESCVAVAKRYLTGELEGVLGRELAMFGEGGVEDKRSGCGESQESEEKEGRL